MWRRGALCNAIVFVLRECCVCVLRVVERWRCNVCVCVRAFVCTRVFKFCVSASLVRPYRVCECVAFCVQPVFLVTMTMTHSEKPHIHRMKAWPYRQACRGHDPTKKNLFCWCSLLVGKVCRYKLLGDRLYRNGT